MVGPSGTTCKEILLDEKKIHSRLVLQLGVFLRSLERVPIQILSTCALEFHFFKTFDVFCFFYEVLLTLVFSLLLYFTL
jgi:hypothetical protein